MKNTIADVQSLLHLDPIRSESINLKGTEWSQASGAELGEFKSNRSIIQWYEYS